MSRLEHDPDGAFIRLVADGISFLGEQNGLPETQLKAQLSHLFAEQGTVQRAYLAIVQYSRSGDHHVALCLATATKEDVALVRKVSAVVRSLIGRREHLDTIFLVGPQEMQLARVCRPFFAAGPSGAGVSQAAPAKAVAPPEGSAHGGAAVDFTPRMPEVDVRPDLDSVFARARRVASGDEPVPAPVGLPQGQRHVVVVTPGRMLMLQRCPRPGLMPHGAVTAIEKIAPSAHRLDVTVIAFTDLRALREGFSKAIPFAGYLLGLAYVGHNVVVFEGHPSALRAGCRDADMLVVDEAMIPALQPDWRAVAWSVMRTPQALLFGRNGSLKRIVKKDKDIGH